MGLLSKLFGPPNIRELKKRGDVHALIKALKYKDPDIQHQAVVALGQLGDPAALEPLYARAVGATKSGVTRSALKQIRKIGGPEAEAECRSRLPKYEPPPSYASRFLEKTCPICGGTARLHPGGNSKDVYPSWNESGPGSHIPEFWTCSCGYRS
ncbi:HEAT repeat domain-containing protein [Gemmatimonadota bacterium]